MLARRATIAIRGAGLALVAVALLAASSASAFFPGFFVWAFLRWHDSCETECLALSVDLRTDYEAGSEVSLVETVLRHEDGTVVGSQNTPISSGDPLASGHRVADLSDIWPNKYYLDVTLYGAGAAVLKSRRLGMDLREDFAVTAVIPKNDTPVDPDPAAPLEVTKTWSLPAWGDLHGDGLVTTGDTVQYLVDLWNTSDQGQTPVGLTGVVYEERVEWIFQGQIIDQGLPPLLAKEGEGFPSANDVTVVSEGSQQVLTGTVPGTLAPGQHAWIQFWVVVAQVATYSQGEATSQGYFDIGVLSDDPSLMGSINPTQVVMTTTGINQCRQALAAAELVFADDDADGLTGAEESALGTDPDDSDSDGDGLLDGAEVLGPDGVAATGDETDPLDPDVDGDGVPDGSDGCPHDFDPSLADADGDGVQDACDNCAGIFNGGQADADLDGVGDACDLCRVAHDPSNADTGGFATSTPDGIGDACTTADVDHNGRFDIADVARIRRELDGLEPGMSWGVPTTGCRLIGRHEVFTPDMFGCRGTDAWEDRAWSCAPGWRVCTAAEWVARRNGGVPSWNYWTDDQLRYSGSPSACSVSTTTGLACDFTTPMRVCGASTDPLGNTCNWTGCGYESTAPNEYFGGCNGDIGAGTLCCR